MPTGIYKKTEEHKQKIGLANKGKKNPKARNNPQVFKKGVKIIKYETLPEV